MARKYVTFWSVAIVVFILDRLTKLWVRSAIPLNSSVDFSFFSFTHVLNTGTLWGLAKGASWFFIVLATAVSVYLILKHASFPPSIQPVLGLVLAGALGNLTDRIMYGAVIDFIDLGWWPVFNVADSAIVVAVAWLLVVEYGKYNRNI